MNDPALFSKCNNLPRRDAEEFLKANVSKVKWKTTGDRSIDIGSADGGVTTKILKKYLPENYRYLVGCDIGGNMVKFANEHYRDDRTFFIEHDLRDDVIEELKGKFDHVFSFYTIHWIQNQRTALGNIYRMLTDGGDCLLMLVAYSSIFAVYRLLSQNSRWTPWIQNVEQFVSPYHDCLDPARELQLYMEEVGFKNVEVTCQHKSYLYKDVNFLKETMAGICPFKIPKDMIDEYLNDFVETAIKHQVIEEVLDADGNACGFNYLYSLLWAYGC